MSCITHANMNISVLAKKIYAKTARMTYFYSAVYKLLQEWDFMMSFKKIGSYSSDQEKQKIG